MLYDVYVANNAKESHSIDAQSPLEAAEMVARNSFMDVDPATNRMIPFAIRVIWAKNQDEGAMEDYWCDQDGSVHGVDDVGYAFEAD